MPGQKIGRYLIEEKVGQGAMGEVFRALDSRIHRIVAIKTLHLSKLYTPEEKTQACALILKEARITGQLNHGHIATIHDMGIHEGTPYLVMEYIRGQNLKELIRQKAVFALNEKLAIISLIAKALHYAHQHGVLHRDIKPANIMLQENGSPKITDFGIALLERGGAGGCRQFGPGQEEFWLAGTPSYIAPEAIKHCRYDARSDLFSLGVLAYEWLSGRRPFTGAATEEIIQAITGQAPLPLSSLCLAGLEVERIIHQALEKKPERRFPNAEQFSDAIELYLNSLETQRLDTPNAARLEEKARIIARLRQRYLFFSDFSDEELATIFRLAHKRSYIPGEYLIREKTVGTRMYVITSGQVSVQTESEGQVIELERLAAGSCVGEMALVDKRERSASVVALKPTEAIAINETVLRLKNPEICLKLYRNLAAMLSERLRGQDERYRKLLATRGITAGPPDPDETVNPRPGY